MAPNILVNGFLDTDSEVKFIQPGDYPHAEFWDSGMAQSSNAGAGESVPGLRAEPLPAAVTANHILTGGCEWITENFRRVILMFQDTVGTDHCIYYYDFETSTYTQVATSALLNFKRRIIKPFVLNNVLFYSDGYFENHGITGGIFNYNSPKAIDLVRFADGTYPAVTYENIDFVKYPPRFAPTCVVGTEPNRVSKLKGRGFKFVVSYQCDKNELTRWSPASKSVVFTERELLNGDNYIEWNIENYIDVTVPTGNEQVKYIRIAVADAEIEGLFYMCAELNKFDLGIADDSTYTYRFYNDENLTPLPGNELPYDSVPDISQCLIHIPNNRLAFLNNLYDFDNVDVDLRLALKRTEITNHTHSDPMVRCTTRNGGPAGIYYVLCVCSYVGPVYSPIAEAWQMQAGYTLQCMFPKFEIYPSSPLDPQPNGSYFVGTYTLTSADITAIDALGTYALKEQYVNEKLRDALLAQNPTLVPVSVSYISADGADHGVNIRTTTINSTALANPMRNDFVIIKKTSPKPTLSRGTKKISIVYADRANRDGTVQYKSTGSQDIYIPIEPEDAAGRSSFSNVNNPYVINITAAILSRPPLWATHYYFAVPDEPAPLLQRVLCRRPDVDPTTQRLRWTLCKNYHQDGNTAHLPQPGDILTVISRRNQPDLVPNTAIPQGQWSNFNLQSVYLDRVLEYQVLEYSPSEGWDGNPCVYTTMNDVEIVLNQGMMLVEIETPKPKIEATAWRLIGEGYPILDAHTGTRRHAGNIQNQSIDYTIPAEVLLEDYGDLWYRPRRYETNQDAEFLNEYDLGRIVMPIKDPHFSDFYKSQWTDRDNMRLAIWNPRNKRLNDFTDIIHSEVFHVESETNGLHSFNPLSRKKLLREDGPICFAIDKGASVVSILQAKRETSWYVNQSFALGPGASVPTFSNEVFGAIYPLQTNFGCQDPLSVAKDKSGNLYYYDRLKGVFVKSTGGGQFEISTKQKFKNYSLKVNNDIAIHEAVLIGFYDESNESYHCAIRRKGFIHNTAKCEVAVYKSLYDRWKRLDPYDVYYAFSIGEQTIIGSPIEHMPNIYFLNEGDELRFYEGKTAVVDAVFNNDWPLMKKLQSINIASECDNNEESVDVDVTVAKTQAGFENQISKIFESNWQKIQGYRSAPFNKDILSKKPPQFIGNEQYMLTCGDELVGYTAICRLKISSSAKIKISHISVSSVPITP